ncbi:hypothetical protein [Mesorhizobium sp. M5C.F.Ca.ET.164.01.1.1]|uniref:hypothetical protein n=1 Tax=Mesorhizobium sp. M5C.F.Ca.ET.164.01.1.1 TaxID=2563957 RepID=UPI0010936F17|nr:hypothetical protein [Mesorhizobium sp. M5C.F.Ca.ET.164.01.1.1]TGT93870.1 hypothetical protein EN807_26845 [Mesorhizobium sp. M5C.F.Ca.ET.164.01.1.1]
MARSSRAAKRITSLIVPVLVLVVYIATLGGGSAFTTLLTEGRSAWFGLSDQDTVQAYLDAAVEDRGSYAMHLCHDGVCITQADWACGFVTVWLGGESEEYDSFDDAIEDCFSKLIRVVPVGVKLIQLQRICGQRFMTFRPRFAGKTAEDCEAAGGQWGVKVAPRADAALYLATAGVRQGVE